jgi:hypothetical protein
MRGSVKLIAPSPELDGFCSQEMSYCRVGHSLWYTFNSCLLCVLWLSFSLRHSCFRADCQKKNVVERLPRRVIIAGKIT